MSPQKPSLPIPGQTELLAAHSHDGLHYVTELPPNPDTPLLASADPLIDAAPGVAVNVHERAQHLGAALTVLAGGSRADGFIKRQALAPAPHITERYGKQLPAVNAFVEDEAEHHLRNVRNELSLAYGDREALTHIGQLHPEEIEGDFNLIASAFRRAYGGARGAQDRNHYRDYLRTADAARQGQPPRRRKARLEVPEPLPASMETIAALPPEAREKLLETVDTYQKLVILRDDPRARFLPATHREKNDAVTLLDYLDSPQHPNGVTDQLQEIYDHQKKVITAKLKTMTPVERRTARISPVAYAEAARTSKVYEYGDYLSSAVSRVEALADLAARVEACPNPAVLLLEEVGPGHAGYAPLVQFMDLRALRDRRLQTTGFDPLRTTEDRERPQTLPDKHKTLEDSYTATQPAEAVAEHIDATIAGLTIGKVRRLVTEAYLDQEQRLNFWAGRLGGVRGRQHKLAQLVLAQANVLAAA